MPLKRTKVIQLYSLFAFSVSAIIFASLSLTANSVEAKTFTLRPDYKGKICITGSQTRGTVSVQWGAWSYSFNPTQTKEEVASQGISSGAAAGDNPFGMVAKLAFNAWSAADRLAARSSPGYNLELSSGGGSIPIFISDNTARAKYGRCNFIGSPFLIER